MDKSYHIKYLRKGKNRGRPKIGGVTCYNPSAGNGWCGTCYDLKGDAVKENQEGYCSTQRSRRCKMLNLYSKRSLENVDNA